MGIMVIQWDFNSDGMVIQWGLMGLYRDLTGYYSGVPPGNDCDMAIEHGP